MSQSIPVLFESGDFLVLNKPYGVASNKSSTYSEPTVQDFLHEKLGLLPQADIAGNASDFVKRAGLVHRLDKDTTGVLLAAKHEKAFIWAQKQFKERTVEKTYRAIVIGDLEDDEFEITAGIERSPRDRHRFEASVDGREAQTFFTVLKRFSIDNQPFTYLEARPKTGRTHQIRVHLAALNHPVAGDTLYCSKKQFDIIAGIVNRMMLHAFSLKFSDMDKMDVFITYPFTDAEFLVK